MTDVLDAATHMDTLTLHVGDLAEMESYYSSALALTPLIQSGGEVRLGRGSVEILRLIHTPGLPQPSRRQAGLFHTAMLLPDQATLAATVLAAAQDPRSRFAGSSDHHVSEAFYFTDPEGNGLELYADRPRESWQWDGDQVRMTTIYLDPSQFVNSHIDRDLVESGRRPELSGVLGHAHLQVGDIATAHEFYVGVLGFDQTARMGRQALFVSAGGYHHHMAMNTWSSEGVGLRAPGLGLGRVDIVVPSAADVAELTTRARSRGVQIREEGGAVELDDPWGNLVRLSA